MRERLRLLPLALRLFLAVVLIALAYPGFAALHGALHGAAGSGVLAWSSHHLSLVWMGAAAAVIVALLLAEPPRGPSARAYAAQLRDRLRAIQAEFERAVEAALSDRKLRVSDKAGPDAPGVALEQLDGLRVADNTRR